jgi:hypothetical protein
MWLEMKEVSLSPLILAIVSYSLSCVPELPHTHLILLFVQ